VRLSTRSRYGLRAVISIARSVQSPVTAETLAACEGVSKKYLDRLLNTLRSAGLLNGTKGKGGGYTLARPAERITAGDVVRALEGDMRLVPCVGDPDACARTDSCTTRRVWISVEETVKETLNGMTIADIAALKPRHGPRDPLHRS
jgi:Rrf2 family protein